MAEEQDWVGILRVMEHCASKLPEQCENDLWRSSLQTLAELVAETRDVLGPEYRGILVSIGALMVRQIGKEAEAQSLTEQLFSRVREGGAS